MLNGTAGFMAARFKDELTNYSIHLALRRLSADEPISLLFKNSFDFIQTIRDKGVYYYSDLALLRYQAETDLEELPEHSFDYFIDKSDENIKPLLKDAKLIYQVINEIHKSKNPYEGINSAIYVYKQQFPDLNRIQLLNNAMRNIEGSDRLWISDSDLSNDTLAVLVMKGLLLEQFKRLKKPEPDENLVYIINEMVTVYCHYFQTIDSKLVNLSVHTKPSAAEVGDILKAVYGLFKPLVIEKISQSNSIALKPSIAEVVPVAIDLWSYIQDRNFGYLMPTVVKLSQVIDARISSENRVAFQSIAFLLDLNMAQNAADVQALIESAALPIGSASIKRSTPFNLAFNGYVGFTGGIEWLDRNQSSGDFNYGLTAPIGIAISFKPGTARNQSWTTFLSVLDIGSLVNQSLASDIETDTKIRFEQFLAPGLGVFYNVPKSPFTFGIHSTYNPSKRRWTIDQSEIRHLNVWRANASIMVDIPFFNLISR